MLITESKVPCSLKFLELAYYFLLNK